MAGKTFCEIPWVGLTLDSRGLPRICCEAISSDAYVNDRGEKLNAGKDSIDEIRNSVAFRDVRTALLKGGKPELCRKCWDDEAAGITSLRQTRGHGLLSEGEARKITDSSGRVALPKVPFVPELRLSNLCNLKCRMCGPEFSSAWYAEANALGEAGRTLFELEEPEGRTAMKLGSPRFRASLRDSLPSIRKIFFTGGEPLLEKSHEELLEQLVEGGHAPRVALSYTTNLTRLPKRILELWAEFDDVHVGVSLDGVGKVQEYIRHPARWNEIERNIRALDTIAAERGWSAIFQTTVSTYNVFDLEELVKWYAESGLRAFRRLEIRRLWQPKHLNIQALPGAAKREAKAALLRAAERAGKHSLEETEGSLRGLARYLEAEDRSADWPVFVLYTLALDKLRSQKVGEAIPALGEFLKAREPLPRGPRASETSP